MVKSFFVKLSWHSLLTKQLYICPHCNGLLQYNPPNQESSNFKLNWDFIIFSLFQFPLKSSSGTFSLSVFCFGTRFYIVHLETLVDTLIKMGLLSGKATCNTHGQDSSYFLGWQEYEKNPYDEVQNPTGIIQMGLAENQVAS